MTSSHYVWVLLFETWSMGASDSLMVHTCVCPLTRKRDVSKTEAVRWQSDTQVLLVWCRLFYYDDDFVKKWERKCGWETDSDDAQISDKVCVGEREREAKETQRVTEANDT